MTPFDPALATKIAMEMAEDDERATAGPWKHVETIRGAEVLRDYVAAGVIPDQILPIVEGDMDPANCQAIARLRNNARSAASQLRAAVAEVESLTRDNAILVAQRNAWQANADRIALERRSEEMAAIHDRDRLAAENQRLRSGTCSGVIPSTHTACGEGGNYCSEACRLAARVKELEVLAGEACDIAARLATVRTTEIGRQWQQDHVSRIDEIRSRLGGK